MRAFAIAILLLAAVGCDKDKEGDIRDPAPINDAGIYKGTFQRTGQLNGGPKVPVTLEFGHDTFKNLGTLGGRYPTIGRGSFKITNGEVNFQDSTFYTADFDWSLILSGKYKMGYEGDSIVISRDYNGHYQDTYKLKMQR